MNNTGTQTSIPIEQAALTALVVAWAGMVTWIVFTPMRSLLLVMPDDAFYYLAIAQNWAKGFPSTFDRIEATNGYHPLWQWLLILPAWGIRSPEWFARFSAILSMALIAASAMLMKRTLQNFENRDAWFALLWCPLLLFPAMIHGMEMPFAIMVLSLFILRVSCTQPSTRSMLLTGVVSSALVLARLDMLPFVFCGAFAILMRQPSLMRIRSTCVLLGPALISLALFFIGNKVIFGTWTPISAATKLARSGWLSLDIPYCFLMGIALLSVPLWTGTLIRRHPLSWVAAGTLIYLALIFLRGGLETWDWYFAAPAALIGVVLPCLTSTVTPRRGCATLTALFLCTTIATVADVSTRENKFAFYHDRSMMLAEYPQDMFTFAASDVGVLGYFSRQQWINLDGLTAGTGFHASLRDNRFAEYLRNAGLNAVIDVNQAPFPERLSLQSWTGLDGISRSVHVTVTPWFELNEYWMIMRIDEILPVAETTPAHSDQVRQ